MEANFSEPRSLFGGLNKGNTAFNASSSKKRKILGLPFNYTDAKSNYKHDSASKDIFGLNLETVQEKEKPDKSVSLDINSLHEKGSLKNSLRGGITKKIVNGGVVSQ